jgi:hypothetical protein
MILDILGLAMSFPAEFDDLLKESEIGLLKQLTVLSQTNE